MVNPFLQSIFVQPTTVLGSKLRPFSAYHAAAMMLFKSPFMTGGVVSAEELVMAVYICSYGFEDGPPHLFPLDVEEIANCPTDFDLSAEIDAFEEYVGDHLEFPEVLQAKSAGKSQASGIPWPFYVVATVMQGMGGITEQAAWDMPLSRLVAYKAAIAEQAGASVLSDAQADAISVFEQEED